MLKIDGKEYISHSEYFAKYPWKRAEFRRKNFKLYAEKSSQRCADCKMFWHPGSMTLDHIDRDGYKNATGKRVHPANMLNYYPPVFAEEMQKCEPVCSNCHKLREMTRDGHTKTGIWKDWADVPREGALLT